MSAPAPNAPLTREQLEALRRLDACVLANAIETFNVRLRHVFPIAATGGTTSSGCPRRA